MRLLGLSTPVWGSLLESAKDWTPPVVIVTPFIRELVAKQAKRTKG